MRSEDATSRLPISRKVRLAGAVLGLLCTSQAVASEAEFQVIHSVTEAEAGSPELPVIDRAGNLYLYHVVSSSNGSRRDTLYKLATDGSYTLLHSFTGGAKDAEELIGKLNIGADGALYGSSRKGGVSNLGTVFKLDPGTGQVTLLHNFNGDDTEGQQPVGVSFGPDGALYGATNITPERDVVANFRIFRLDTQGTFSIVHRIIADNLPQDSKSIRRIIEVSAPSAADGSIAGFVTGPQSAASLFKIDSTGAFSLPFSALRLQGGFAVAADGSVYGTTGQDAPSNAGNFFKIDPSGNTTILFALGGNTTEFGSEVSGALALGSDGKLYGTPQSRGPSGGGTVLSVDPLNKQATVVHAFGAVAEQGSRPHGVTFGPDGNLYGVALDGGQFGHGLIYRVRLNSGATDTTPPVITPKVTGKRGTNGWYTGDINLSWDVQDNESAISSSEGCQASTITTDTAGTTLTCSASSRGGKTAKQIVLKRDTSPPTLNPIVSPSPVLLNGKAKVNANASDKTSGLATTSCETPATDTVGKHKLSCKATDLAGNVTNASANYKVLYFFKGLYAPLSNPPTINRAEAGRFVAFVWRLVDAAGKGVSTLTDVKLKIDPLACPTTAGQDIALDVFKRPGFRNLGNGNYRFNWEVPKNYAGSCKTVKLVLDERSGQTHTALFQFKGN